MTVNAVLVDSKNHQALHFEELWRETETISGNEVFLVSTNAMQTHGTYTNVQRSSAGTTTVTTPISGGCIQITDLVLNTEKRTGGSVEIQFTDGTNSITVFKVFCNDAPANIVLPVVGKFRGWVNARLDMVVTGATDCSATLGYVKLPTGASYESFVLGQ
jgi:predicted protein tyrosine phosphatase